MSQLSAAKKGCNICSGQISWDANIRARLNTKLPLNLDGTIHDKASCETAKNLNFAGPGYGPTDSNSNNIDDKDIDKKIHDLLHASKVMDEKALRIEKAHQENMQASEQLRTTIAHQTETLAITNDRLATINDTMSVLNVILKTYLQSRLDEGK